MLTAFFLGLAGSLSHCVGMCSAVMMLVGRGRAPSDPRLLVAQLGRLCSYAALGGLAGALGGGAGALLPHAGHHAAAPSPGLRLAQGGLALLMAATALYMALALLGRAPSPELALARLTRGWSRMMRRVGARPSGWLGLYAAGLLWGLLPCGLVLTALLPAAAAGSPARGALAMLAFGLGTLPALLGVGWLGYTGRAAPWLWPRQAAALLVLLFGAQMALRGLAAWGWVGHLSIEGVMLW